MLLDAVIKIAEKERVSLYLETETEKNVQLYEYSGFEVIEQVDLPIINLPMWEMVQNPA